MLGIEDVSGTTTGNLTDAGAGDERRTAALVQYPQDGHFAIFNNPAARQLFTHFFQTLREDGVPTIRTSGE